MCDTGVEEGQQHDESGRRSSLAGQALVPSLSNTASELAKERSFCNPEDTEEAAAIGRQACALPFMTWCCNGSSCISAGLMMSNACARMLL